MLFAVTVSSILLAIALGVANIALKEVRFGTSAKDTNDAFFAADTAMEYVLFNDKPPTSSFIPAFGTFRRWADGEEDPAIVIPGLGSGGQACAIVTIEKDNTSPPTTTTKIVSKGYNTGGGLGGCDPAANSVERELTTSY